MNFEINAEPRAVAPEFLPHAERADNQRLAAGPRAKQANGFDLHERLAESERSEDRPRSAAHCPLHNVALVRLEQRIDLVPPRTRTRKAAQDEFSRKMPRTRYCCQP